MKHGIPMFLLAALLFVGCSSNNKGKIEDTKWKSLATTVDGVPLPVGALSLEFGEKSVRYYAGPQTFSGTYSLGFGDTVTLKFKQKLAGRNNHAEKISIKGDTLTMTDSDGTALSFSRVGAKKATTEKKESSRPKR